VSQAKRCRQSLAWRVMAKIEYPGANELEDRTIRQIAAVAMDAPARAKSGHSGTAMALAPLGVTLFSRVMQHDPLDPTWPDRDRFILSNGHASILQYGLANAFGYDLNRSDLMEFRQAHSRTPGHPEVGHSPTVEVTTGPLGQGFADGVGMALAERILRAQHGEELVNHRVWVIAGDGCLEEGISHEAASFAGRQALDRLTVFYDNNHITIDGPTELAFHDDTAQRFAAYGWQVIDLGERANDLNALENACELARADTRRPTLIMVRSHIGFPSPTMMDRKEAHGNPFSEAAISEAKALLGVPDEPFCVDEGLGAEWVSARSASSEVRHQWEARVAAAGERGTALLAQLASGGVNASPGEIERYESGAVATRKALQRALDTVGIAALGLVSGSADLTENTGVSLPNTVVQSPETPEGRQIHYGIREFAMGAIMVGLARHGGIRPLGSTFFVFSDYQRPAIRLAALSESPVLFVFTHDSIGVGEDGPTHQPIEQLMSLRAMPNLHVVRPSDANETLDLVSGLLSSPHMSPTALILSRQDIPVMTGDDAAASRESSSRGGYVVREDPSAQISLVAAGAEVALCLGASDVLRERGVATRVVALPCWACFEAQSAEYRTSVVRRDVRSVAIEAGATLGWYKYVDEALGIDTFGMSAPASYIFDYLNISVDALVAHVMETVGEHS
jgi:transketolase